MSHCAASYGPYNKIYYPSRTLLWNIYKYFVHSKSILKNRLFFLKKEVSFLSLPTGLQNDINMVKSSIEGLFIGKSSLHTHILSRATSPGLQVTVAWGHGWRAPKCARIAHWLEPPTYWATLSQIYTQWNWNSKLNAKLSLEFQFEYGFKLEFQVELLIIRESVPRIHPIRYKYKSNYQ